MVFGDEGKNLLNANIRGVESSKKKHGIWTPNNDIFKLMAQFNGQNRDIITTALANKNIYNYEVLIKRARGKYLGKFIYNIVKEYIEMEKEQWKPRSAETGY